MASAFIAGLLSLILQSASIGTDYWVNSDYDIVANRDSFKNDTDLGDVPLLIQHAGLWRICAFEPNATFLAEEAVIICSPVDFKGSEGPTSYHTVIFYCAVISASFSCICILLQVFGVLSGAQAAWQMKASLYTDCGLMYSFAAIFDALVVSLYIVSILYRINERPGNLVSYPDGYQATVHFSWSFYCSAIAFLCCSFSGTLYLLIARHWRKQEIYSPGQEDGKDKKDQKFTYRRSIVSIPKL
ncbi:transmembrane protein 114-like [Glandiceps talaboti]